ncbi:MAG: hypothetical protein EZS28_007618 [Streblomastix strix]|uniref:Uncharacterized protein n=1 Tax=Streblomastix strix TaxID=222440 RepID=A0A5J4WR42_9EUKA|nr:MAG: hypothetical protein EZS28_007618 [Streblomastix strix]
MSEQKEEELSDHQNKKPRITELQDEEASVSNPQSQQEDTEHEDVVEADNLLVQQDVIKLVVTISNGKSIIEQQEKLNLITAGQMVPLVRKMNSKQIKATFDMPLCVELAVQFNEGKTQTELELLNVVEIIAKCASEQKNQKSKQNFADIFTESGLQSAIGQCIHNQIPEPKLDDEENDDNNMWMLDDDVLQLARIYCYMTYISNLDNPLCFFCGLIICRNVNFNVYFLQEQCKQLLKSISISNKRTAEREIIEYTKKLTEILTLIKFISEEIQQRHTLFHHCDLDSDLGPLFHINCPPDLNCPHSIVFPLSIDGEPLHLLTLEIYTQFFEFLNRQNLFQVDDNKVVDHLAPVIITFASNTSFWRKYSMKKNLSLNQQYLISSQTTLQQFLVYLNLVHNLFVYCDRYASYVTSNSDLISVLVALTTFNQKEQKQDLDIGEIIAAKIREQAIEIISEICQSCEEPFQKKILVDMKFAQSLTYAAGIGGGSEEENNSVILSALRCFDEIIDEMNGEVKYEFVHSKVYSDAVEMIEQEGGFEEFDSVKSGRNL